MKFSSPTLALMSPVAEAWQIVAGLEAILIVVLFLGWLHAACRPTGNSDVDEDQSP